MTKQPLTNAEISTLCASLGYLIGAGLPYSEALHLLAEDEKKSSLAQTLSAMANRVEDGLPLCDAMREAGCFPPYVISLTDVGGRVGRLEETLHNLARYYRDRDERMRHLRASLLYPAALLGVLFVVVTLLLVWVLPIFADVYAQFGGTLRGAAGFFASLGEILRVALPFLVILAALIAILMLIPSVRRAAVHFVLRWWGDSGAFRQINTARFVQALALGVTSGMTDAEAVDIAVQLAGEEIPAFTQRCEACHDVLLRGETLSEALRESGFVRASDTRLLDAGARSGKGDTVLTSIAEDLLLRGEEALDARLSAIEPTLVAVSAVMIGGILLSVLLPLMQIMNTIG